MNGDGVADFIIGAVGDRSNSAEGYVIFGSANGFPAIFDIVSEFGPSLLDGTNGFAFDSDTFPSSETQSSTSISVSGAGDFNGDGIDDIIVGTPGHNGGRASS